MLCKPALLFDTNLGPVMTNFKWVNQKMPEKFAAGTLFFSIISIATAPHVQANEWNADQARQLRQLTAASLEDALPVFSTTDLDRALAQGPGPELDAAATALALRLARAHLLGTATDAQRTGWKIADTDRATDLTGWLERARAGDGLATFFAALRPAHPDYAALRAAYARERDPDRKLALARNMERWRWLPRTLGPDHILVNTATFEARLWRGGKQAGTWRVIVGKTSTPTPVFTATVTGVNLNPWWNIPASIVREKRGRFPASQGYVYSGGQWRQKPGPNNALGQMKLVMPNPYSVYLHDTPSKQLFERDVRAFSHGCIRTGDALGFAATLLEGVKTKAEIDRIVQSRQSVVVDLPQPLPVYITYFTAAPGADGTVTIAPDIYRRDTRVPAAPPSGETCGV